MQCSSWQATFDAGVSCHAWSAVGQGRRTMQGRTRRTHGTFNASFNMRELGLRFSDTRKLSAVSDLAGASSSGT